MSIFEFLVKIYAKYENIRHSYQKFKKIILKMLPTHTENYVVTESLWYCPRKSEKVTICPDERENWEDYSRKHIKD